MRRHQNNQPNQYSAFHLAAEQGDIRRVKDMVTRYPNFLLEKSSSGETALALARKARRIQRENRNHKDYDKENKLQTTIDYLYNEVKPRPDYLREMKLFLKKIISLYFL